MTLDKKPGVIPVFVPHLGCPHDCVFCNQKKITGRERQDRDTGIDKVAIIDNIEAHLESIGQKRHPIEIAFFGGSFTGIEPSVQIEYLEIARRYILDGRIHGIRLSTRPDYINEEILLRLIKYGVTTIELGVQSLDEKVLLASNRGHSKSDVEKAVGVIRRLAKVHSVNIQLGLQMMLGLPEDTLATSMKTAQGIIGLKPDFVRIYPTVVIRETALEMAYSQGAYKALDVETTVEWLSEIMPMFSKADIPIIRVGLQPTDDLTDGQSRVAGAYHPSLRQLAQSAIILKSVMQEINSLQDDIGKADTIKVRASAHRKDWTQFYGVGGKNVKALAEAYGKIEFDFVISDTISRGAVTLEFEYEIGKNTYTSVRKLENIVD